MAAPESTRRIRLTQALYLLLLLAVAFSDGRSFSGLAGLGAQAAGFLCVTTATLWRIWTTAFIAGRKDVELVDVGPYARCRHPLYFGSLLAGLGIALSTKSLVLTILLPAVLAVIHGGAQRREDRFLADRHGEAWRAYRARVPAFWPRLQRMPAAAAREVDLAIFRKAFFDAATMFSLWLLVVAADALRVQGAWQAFFRLP